jgi:hypothetical protein
VIASVPEFGWADYLVSESETRESDCFTIIDQKIKTRPAKRAVAALMIISAVVVVPTSMGSSRAAHANVASKPCPQSWDQRITCPMLRYIQTLTTDF